LNFIRMTSHYGFQDKSGANLTRSTDCSNKMVYRLLMT
jgi:hypothetical protein